MEENMKVLSKEEEEKVVGGVRSYSLDRRLFLDGSKGEDMYSKRRASWANDEAKKAKIRKAAEDYRAMKGMLGCAFSSCPGCGMESSRSPFVCWACEQQANS